MKNKSYSISINDNVYLVNLIDKKIKTIRLKIKNNEIFISGYHINENIANEMINKHKDWIIKNINKPILLPDFELYKNFEIFYLLGEKVDIVKDCKYFYIKDDKFSMPKEIDVNNIYKKLRFFYKNIIESRVIYYQKIFNNYNPVIYKDMKSRFGYNDGNKQIICLSTRLIHLPEYLIDYIIVHEFCHYKVRNHQKEFYQEVSKYYPNYLKAKKELKIYSPLMK